MEDYLTKLASTGQKGYEPNGPPEVTEAVGRTQDFQTEPWSEGH